MKVLLVQDFLNKIPAKYHAIIYAIISIFCIYIAGEASRIIAFFANDKGINFPIREFINLVIILLFAKIFFARENELVTIKDFNLSAIIIGAFCASFIVFGSWAIALFTRTISIASKSNFANITLFFSFIILFIHGFCEEFIAQKFVRTKFVKTYGRLNGILLCALIFPIIQFLQGYRSPIFIIDSYLIGLVFTILANRFGYISAAAMHGIWTWLELVLFPEILTLKVNQNNIWFSQSDTYGSVSLLIICMVLIFALSLFDIFGYKNAHDKKQH